MSSPMARENFLCEQRAPCPPQPSRLQEVLDFLPGVFNWFGSWTNVNKMVGMTCHPFLTAIRQSEAACEQWMMA